LRHAAQSGIRAGGVLDAVLPLSHAGDNRAAQDGLCGEMHNDQSFYRCSLVIWKPSQRLQGNVSPGDRLGGSRSPEAGTAARALRL